MMYDREPPEWNRFDTLKSLRDLGSLALDTVANLITINFDIKDEELPQEEK